MWCRSECRCRRAWTERGGAVGKYYKPFYHQINRSTIKLNRFTYQVETVLYIKPFYLSISTCTATRRRAGGRR
jgi:hypothetical protein